MSSRKGGFGWAKATGAIALGAAAGSALALLFAPTSGRAMRKRIGSKLRFLQRSASRGVVHAQKLIRRKAGNLREAAMDKLEDTRRWMVQRASNGSGRQHASARR